MRRLQSLLRMSVISYVLIITDSGQLADVPMQ